MRILVGYDGSEGADAALIDLQRAGLPDQAEALIVSVADVTALPETSSYEFAGPVLASRRLTAGLMFAEKQRERILDVAAESARKGVAHVQSYFPNWDVRAEKLAGSASWELLNKAHFWRPDLIVVGSNGRSALGRFVLGSVSKNIVTDSEHSVRVAREVIDEKRASATENSDRQHVNHVESCKSCKSDSGEIGFTGFSRRVQRRSFRSCFLHSINVAALK